NGRDRKRRNYRGRRKFLAPDSSLLSADAGRNHWHIVLDCTVLSAMPQQVIHQYQCQHGLGDGCCPDTDTGIMTPFGDDFHWITVNIDTAARYVQTAGRLEGNIRYDILPRRDTAEDAAGVDAEKTFRRDLVTMLAAALFHHRDTFANLHPFIRLDTHQCMSNFRIETIKDRLSQPRGNTAGHYRNPGAD